MPQPLLPFFGLSDRPRRKAIRLIASDDRPSCFAASSNETEDLASCINLRSSLNDQGLRAMTETILSHRHHDKAAKRSYVSLAALLGWGPTLGKPGAEMDMRSMRLRNKQWELS